MRLSVIVSVYNRAHFLKDCLLSLTNQSELPDEIIITDDGSQEDIISEIKPELDLFSISIKFVTQQDKGFRLAKCRNNGVRESYGDFLLFLDQDLLFTKNFIKTLRENILKDEKYKELVMPWMSAAKRHKEAAQE